MKCAEEIVFHSIRFELILKGLGGVPFFMNRGASEWGAPLFLPFLVRSGYPLRGEGADDPLCLDTRRGETKGQSQEDRISKNIIRCYL